MFSSAWNEPSSCLWYDEWPTKLHNENVRSLRTCDMQLSSSIYYILVTSVYQSKWPVWWSLVWPSGCLWYDKRSTMLPVENLISLKSRDMQHSNSIYAIFVMSVYQSKQPFCWPLEYQMDCVATQNMISVPLSFLLMLCYHLAYAWLRQGTLWDHYGT